MENFYYNKNLKFFSETHKNSTEIKKDLIIQLESMLKLLKSDYIEIGAISKLRSTLDKLEPLPTADSALASNLSWNTSFANNIKKQKKELPVTGYELYKNYYDMIESYSNKPCPNLDEANLSASSEDTIKKLMREMIEMQRERILSKTNKKPDQSSVALEQNSIKENSTLLTKSEPLEQEPPNSLIFEKNEDHKK